jgi:sec-independent protein translocase protein TatA
MIANLTGAHLIIVAGVIVLLFGATRLPVLSKSIAQSLKILRKDFHTGDGEAGSEDKNAEQDT